MLFIEFMASRKTSLMRFAVVLTGDSRLAEDILQDILGRTFERWDRIGAVDDVNAYVRRMIVNEFVSRQRKWLRARRAISLELRDDVPDPADELTERDALRIELSKLAPRHRAVLVLRYYEGLSDIEIADVLGCSPGTVRGYASRALERLRINIDDQSVARATSVRQARSG